MSALLLRQLLQPACLTCCSAATAAVAAAATVRSQHQQRRWASSSASSSSSSSSQEQMSPPGGMQLTPEQQQHLDALRYLIARPLQAAHNAALLTGLTASYRDLAVVMDQMHKRDILGIPRPLVDEPPPPAAAADAASSSSSDQHQQPSLSQQVQDMQGSSAPLVNHSQMFLPVRDLTKLPDQLPPPGGWLRHHLQEKYMTRITAHAQLLPNHLEVSYHTGAFIFLWSPMETFYPGLMDITNALRYLRPHFKKPRGPKRSERHKKVRASLGWRRTTPYHRQRVFGAPHVPPSLLQQ